MLAQTTSETTNIFTWIRQDPLLLEVVGILVGLLLLILFGAWIKRITRDLHRRRALRNFVTGIDCFIRHDWERADTALESVIEVDPNNTEARVALGDCCRELGRFAEAERLHTEALEVFNDQRLETRVSLAKDLLGLRRPDRAANYLEQVLAQMPRHTGALVAMAKAQEDLYRFAGAAEHLKELLLTLEGPEEDEQRGRLRRKIGKLMTREGLKCEEQDNFEGALEAFRSALSWNPSLTSARSGVIRALAFLGHGPNVLQALEGTLDDLESLVDQPDFLLLPSATPLSGKTRPQDGESLPALPGPAGDSGALNLPTIPSERAGLVLRLMEREALYLCSACEQPFSTGHDECPQCGAIGSLVPTQSTYVKEIEGVDEVMDEVEENRTYLVRLIKGLYQGEEGAGDKLYAAGMKALPVIHEELFKQEEKEPLFIVLRRFGTAALEPLLAIHRERKKERHGLLNGFFGAFGEPKRVFCNIAAAFGPVAAARSFFLSLAESKVEEERRAVLEYFVAAAQPVAFTQLQVFARVEVLNHLSHAKVETLLPLLLNLEEDDFIIEWVLLDSTLQIEDALLAAFAQAPDRSLIASILGRRGFNANVEKALHAFLGHASAQPLARDILAGFADDSLPFRVMTILDPDTGEEARQILTELVAAAGGKAVEDIILRCLGPNPSPVDEVALDLIAHIGTDAQASLQNIYQEEGGILSKFPLVRKRSQRRRELVLRALARIPECGTILAEMVKTETDSSLRQLGENLLRQEEQNDG